MTDKSEDLELQADMTKSKSRSRAGKGSKNKQKKQKEKEKSDRSFSQEKFEDGNYVEQLCKDKSVQMKIDSMLSSAQKDTEPNISCLVQTINSFEEKMNRSLRNLASKIYIDKSIQNVASEKFVVEKLLLFKRDISEEIKKELDKVYDQLRIIKQKLHQSAEEIKELRNETSAMQVEMNKMNEDILKVKEQNKQLQERIDNKDVTIKHHQFLLNEHEQYSRRNNVRIYGVEDKKQNETAAETATKVVNLLKEKLDLAILEQDIDIAHRIGKFQSDGNRIVICKFLRRTTKQKVIVARKKLKGTALVIREDLTSKTAKLLEQVSAREEVKNTWSDEGKIIVLLLNGKKVRIDLNTDLSGLLPEGELAALKVASRTISNN